MTIIDFTAPTAARDARRVIAAPCHSDTPSQRALAWRIEMSRRGRAMSATARQHIDAQVRQAMPALQIPAHLIGVQSGGAA